MKMAKSNEQTVYFGFLHNFKTKASEITITTLHEFPIYLCIFY